MIMNPEEKYPLYEQMYDLCEEQGWGDPFNYMFTDYCVYLVMTDDYSGEDRLMKNDLP